MRLSEFEFCEFLQRAYFYASMRAEGVPVDVGVDSDSGGAAGADECERIHRASDADAADKVLSVNADQHAAQERGVMQVHLAAPVPVSPVVEGSFCCCDVNGFVFDKGHDFEGFALPVDEGGQGLEGVEELLNYMRNVVGRLDNLYALYTDAVLESFIKGFKEGGVYVFQQGDYVHRFFDLFSHELPVMISTLKAIQNELPTLFEHPRATSHPDTSRNLSTSSDVTCRDSEGTRGGETP